MPHLPQDPDFSRLSKFQKNPAWSIRTPGDYLVRDSSMNHRTPPSLTPSGSPYSYLALEFFSQVHNGKKVTTLLTWDPDAKEWTLPGRSDRFKSLVDLRQAFSHVLVRPVHPGCEIALPAPVVCGYDVMIEDHNETGVSGVSSGSMVGVTTTGSAGPAGSGGGSGYGMAPLLSGPTLGPPSAVTASPMHPPPLLNDLRAAAPRVWNSISSSPAPAAVSAAPGGRSNSTIVPGPAAATGTAPSAAGSAASSAAGIRAPTAAESTLASALPPGGALVPPLPTQSAALGRAGSGLFVSAYDNPSEAPWNFNGAGSAQSGGLTNSLSPALTAMYSQSSELSVTDPAVGHSSPIAPHPTLAAETASSMYDYSSELAGVDSYGQAEQFRTSLVVPKAPSLAHANSAGSSNSLGVPGLLGDGDVAGLSDSSLYSRGDNGWVGGATEAAAATAGPPAVLDALPGRTGAHGLVEASTLSAPRGPSSYDTPHSWS